MDDEIMDLQAHKGNSCNCPLKGVCGGQLCHGRSLSGDWQ